LGSFATRVSIVCIELTKSPFAARKQADGNPTRRAYIWKNFDFWRANKRHMVGERTCSVHRDSGSLDPFWLRGGTVSELSADDQENDKKIIFESDN
jgi:hypothetical protein